MIVKLLTERHLEFLSLKGGCTGSSESTHVKMPHCWKSHVTALITCADLEHSVRGGTTPLFYSSTYFTECCMDLRREAIGSRKYKKRKLYIKTTTLGNQVTKSRATK